MRIYPLNVVTVVTMMTVVIFDPPTRSAALVNSATISPIRQGTTTSAAFLSGRVTRRYKMLQQETQLYMGSERKGSSSTGGGQGFGKHNKKEQDTTTILESLDMTYGKDQKKIKDIIIDDEEAMNYFFTTNIERHPLFRSVLLTNEEQQYTKSSRPPAYSFLSWMEEDEMNDSLLKYTETTPWQQLDAIPTLDSHKVIVGQWLDSIQQSLLNIPVDESNTSEDDPLDNHFIMEGKRMLATSRFHVIDEQQQSTTTPLSTTTTINNDDLTRRDTLFMTCWSEMAELRRANIADTGSVILLPGYQNDLVKRFTDMNILKPLMWLGLEDIFEVSSFVRGNLPAIRLLHKLSDIPTDDELRQNREASTLS